MPSPTQVPTVPTNRDAYTTTHTPSPDVFPDSVADLFPDSIADFNADITDAVADATDATSNDAVADVTDRNGYCSYASRWRTDDSR